MAYIIQLFDPKAWDMKFAGTPYDVLPKKVQPLKNWAKEGGADIASNLCFFNFASARYFPLYTLQTLYVDGTLCGKGEASTSHLITLPNGDRVSGWCANEKKEKMPLIESDKIYIPEKRNRSSHSLFGVTTDGKIFTVKSKKGYLQDQLAVLVLRDMLTIYRTHIIYLFEEDGGGSTGVYSALSDNLYAPQREGKNGRSVTSAFLAKLKPCAKIKRTLKYGCVGPDVIIYQIALGSITADGIFGGDTRTRTIQFQKERGLEKDGIAGPITLGELKIFGE